MDRFREMSVFISVAEEGNFAGAARALSMSPPAVTRIISGLEDRIGTRLFNRTTRIVKMTDAGLRFLEDSRRILGELDEAEDAAAGSHAEPRGLISVTAPLLFGRNFVTPLLLEFMDQHPRVEVKALFLDRHVNLVDEGVDIGVRIGHLPDSSITAIRVGQIRSVICGAPSYFEEHGIPNHPEDLANHRAIHSLGMSPRREWQFSRDGEAFGIPISPRFSVSNNDAAIEAATSGWGLTNVLCYQVKPQLLAGKLQKVLTEYELEPWPVHVVHQEGRRASARVRACVDFLVDRLRGDLSIN